MAADKTISVNFVDTVSTAVRKYSRLGHRKHGTNVFAHLDLHQQRTVLLKELQISSR
jgi:hypothetical protein